MRALILALLLVTYSKANSQINIDSLYYSIKNSNLFYPSKPFKSLYLLNTFSHYLKKDSSEEYFVFLDSNGKLSSYLDLSILFEKYDSKKRLIRKVGYSKKGEYSFFDFPPIIENTYNDDTVIEKVFDKNYSIREQSTKIYNKEKQLIELTTISGTKFIKEVIKYSNRLERVKSRFDENGKRLPFEKDVYFIWQKTNSQNEVIEQKYYNEQNSLTNGNHYYDDYNKIDCNYSRFIVKKEGYQKVYYFYNDKDKFMCSYDGAFIQTISE